MRLEPQDRLEGAIARLGRLISKPSTDKGDGEINLALVELEDAAGAVEARQDQLREAGARVDHERRRYREMVNFAPAGYLQTNLQDEIEYVNLAASRILRVEVRRLLGKPLMQFIPVPERKAFRVQLALLHDGQELHGRTARIQPRDADPFTVLLDVVPARDEHGRINGFRWLIREPSSELGHTDRSRRANDLLDSAPVACILLDKDWRLRFVNRAAARVMARSIDELMGQILWEVFPEAATTGFADIAHAVMANGEAFEFEELYQPAKRWLRGVAFPTIDGVCVFFQDITRARRAQGAEAQLAAIVEATALGVLSLTPNGVIETWNEGARKLFGYRASEIVGRKLDALIPEDRKKDLAFLKGRSNDHTQFDTQVVCKDSSLLDVSVAISPMKTASGDLIGYGLIYRPATEQARETRKLKAELRHRSEIDEELRKDMQLKDLLLIAASHDMRSPVTTLIGTAMTLKKLHPFSAGTDEEQLLERLIANGKKLDHLLVDLLDLDRIARGLYRQLRVRVDVAGVARDVVSGSGLDPTQLSIEDSPTIIGDPTLIERIIENLVVNAIKFSGRPEDVRVAVGPYEDGVLVAVDDRGPGVPDGSKERVFEPFARGEARVEGHGLGLSLVRGFAELHGGRVWVEDCPGGGSSFRVFLAADPVPPAEATTRPEDVSR